MDILTMIAELERDEGLRLRVYSDSKEDDLSKLKGKLTIGVGRNLVDNGINKAEAYAMLREDIEDTSVGLDQHLPWWRGLDEVRQRALLNMAFNLGIWPEKAGKLMTFKSTIALIRDGKYAEAAAHIRELPWYKQVPVRAERIVKMLATGATIFLLAACTTQVKQQAKVDVTENIEATDADREMGEMTGEEETTTKAERRESRQPTTIELEVVDTKYAPDGGVEATKKKTFKKTVGQVDINSDKTVAQVAKTQVDVQKQDDKKVASVKNVKAEDEVDKKTDVGPGINFYLWFTVVGVVTLIILAIYLKILKGPL